MYNCECGEKFQSFQEKANHIRWHHKKISFKSSKSEQDSRKKFILANERRFGKWVEEKVLCFKCLTEISIKYREGKKKEKYFCSKSCSNSRNFSAESKEKTSKSVKKAWERGEYKNININKIIFSSKIERKIVEYFKFKYPQYKWKTGGHLRHKNLNISRDLWSDELKLCFEYDGVWHFKDIHGQLEEKQQKDLALEEWCIENSYRLIRIDEQYYTGISQLEEMFFNNTIPIIKIGKRYRGSSSEVAIG